MANSTAEHSVSEGLAATGPTCLESVHSVCWRDEGSTAHTTSHHHKCHFGLMITRYSGTVVRLHTLSALPMEASGQCIKGVIVCAGWGGRGAYGCQVWFHSSHTREGEVGTPCTYGLIL